MQNPDIYPGEGETRKKGNEEDEKKNREGAQDNDETSPYNQSFTFVNKDVFYQNTNTRNTNPVVTLPS
jgi:hypothetical protein